MRKILSLILICFCFFTSKSQDQSLLYSISAQSITSSDLKTIVYDLAAPGMEGRAPGTKGIEKASNYITKYFKNETIGYIPNLKGYYQSFDFSTHRLNKPIFKMGDKTLTENVDYIGTPSTLLSNKLFEIVILKDTSTLSIQELDLKHKTVLFLTADIFFSKKKLYNQLISKGCLAVILCNPNNKKEYNGLRNIYSARDRDSRDKFKKSFSGSISKTDSLLMSLKFKNYYISTLVISAKIAYSIFKEDVKTFGKYGWDKNIDNTKSKNSPVTFSYYTKMVKEKNITNNVLGYIQGSELKEEVIVISAHYDHLGKEGNTIKYGADDNASGVATILEIAQAYSIAIKNGFTPKRSIIFAAFSAEERGLWGSKFFVNNSDTLKIKTVVDLNIDMVGRGEDTHKEQKSKIKKMYVITPTKDTLLLNRIKQIKLGSDSLNLDYSQVGKYGSLSDSDHASFIQKGIPAAMFFRGLHSDYHTEKDTPEKIDYLTMEKIARLIFTVSWKYAIDE
ncbi:MAG: M28 family metallopeptidase [Tenuifilaceae bacterium]